MLVMIDNYDSFTYNLVQYFGELGQETTVFRNDQVAVAKLVELSPDYLVISPGPCTPDQAGISVEAVKALGPTTPVLGVCLGHQSIGQAFGGRIIHAPELMHGKTSMIRHGGDGVFHSLPTPFQATRYHSLVIEPESLPSCLEITARTLAGDIMAVRHKDLRIQGVQFHPESIETHHGHDILRNFLERK